MNNTPNLGETLNGIASNAGGQLISVVTTAIPAVLPFAAVLFGIRYVVKRIGLKA